MMVGNGFHEIRDQTTEKMIDVFAGYERAGNLGDFHRGDGAVRRGI